MRARTYQAWLGFDSTQHRQQSFAPIFVVEPRIEILIHPARSLNREERFEAESGLFDLWLNLVGTMQVRGREPLWPIRGILVNAVRQVTVDDGGELETAKRTLLNTVASGRKA